MFILKYGVRYGITKHLGLFMKILITTEFYLPLRCGVTTAVLNQRIALERQGHEVRILTIGENKESYYSDGVYFIRSNSLKLYMDSYTTFSFHDPLVKDIVRWHPDIVHSQTEFFSMVFAKKIAGSVHAPLIHTCHTDFEAYGVHFMKSQKAWHLLASNAIRRILRNVNYIVCPTTKIRDLLASYHVKPPMQVIPVGLDLDRFAQGLPADERQAIRDRYGFSDAECILVSVCRISAEKNVGETVEHFASLHRLRPDTRLLIVGDGTDMDHVKLVVDELHLHHAVAFTGSIDMPEVWKYYQVGDIFVSSSLSEIQGLTYIEALASGLPIVCHADRSLDDSLIPEKNGYAFTTDEEFLASTLPLVDDADKRLAMGLFARESVGKFGLKVFGDSLLTIYSRLRDGHVHFVS